MVTRGQMETLLNLPMISQNISHEIDLLGDYKKALIYENVIAGGNDDNKKDSGFNWLGKIPENWDVVRVKDGFIQKKAKKLVLKN